MNREQRDQTRREATRRKLLDAAAAVFVRNGYHKTLISDIVAEAGTGQGTFYRYFTDKSEIFSELLEQFSELLLSQFNPMSESLPTNVEDYEQSSRDALNRAAAIVDEHIGLARLFVREAPTIDPAFASRMEEIYSNFGLLARFFLEHGIAHGFARPCDPMVVSQALIGMGLRLINTHLEGPLKPMQREEMIRHGVDFAFRGFGLFDPPPARLGNIEERGVE